MTVIKCETPEQLLTLLHQLYSVDGRSRWYFRGQARASWGLVPTLFRQKEITNPQQYEQVLQRTLLESLRRRSALPINMIVEGHYITALAQHYGCPTRALDWTRAPLAAAYFAAAGSLREANLEEPLSVFVISKESLRAEHVRDCSIVLPLSGANENLAAQNGVLVVHPWTCHDFWRQDFERYVVDVDQPNMNAIISSLSEEPQHFLRFDLPAKLASDLLDDLRNRGVDGVSLFPGHYGFAKTAADVAWQCDRSESNLSESAIGEWVLRKVAFEP